MVMPPHTKVATGISKNNKLSNVDKSQNNGNICAINQDAKSIPFNPLSLS